jgi:5-methylcytosine-specific restriction endonuclease McrA
VDRWLEEHDIQKRNYTVDHKLKSDESWLREQYIEREKTTYDIADMCDCSSSTVRRCLRRHDINIRSSGSVPHESLTDESWLRKKYITEEKTAYDIADMCDCSSHTVYNRLRDHGINIRKPGHILDKRLKNEEWLRRKYIQEGKYIKEIADICDSSHETVRDRLTECDIRIRDQYPTGESHPLWKGGYTPYGSGWNSKKRKRVRELDNYQCMDCGITQADHQSEYDCKLHVHHLIKAKDIDDAEERNAVDNLVTLCMSCHRKWEQMSEAGIKPEIDRLS